MANYNSNGQVMLDSVKPDYDKWERFFVNQATGETNPYQKKKFHDLSQYSEERQAPTEIIVVKNKGGGRGRKGAKKTGKHPQKLL